MGTVLTPTVLMKQSFAGNILAIKENHIHICSFEAMEGGDLSLYCGVSPQTLLPGGGARHAGDNNLQVSHDLASYIP